jgi:hypothetical protein
MLARSESLGRWPVAPVTGSVFRPFGADSCNGLFLPTACAVGCILAPLRGWGVVARSARARACFPGRCAPDPSLRLKRQRDQKPVPSANLASLRRFSSPRGQGCGSLGQMSRRRGRMERGVKIGRGIGEGIVAAFCAGCDWLVCYGLVGISSQGHRAGVIGKARPSEVSFAVDEKLKAEVKIVGVPPRATAVQSSRGYTPAGHDRGRLVGSSVGKWACWSNARPRFKSRG